MDGLSAAASVIGVIQIAGTVASLCSRYLKTAKNAKRDIERLQGELNSLLAVLTGAQSLLEGPKGTRLQTLRELRDGLTECSSQLSDLKAKLEKRRPEATEKILKLIGAHARWPFESSDVDDIIRNLNNCRDTISAALNIDQTILLLGHLEQIDNEERLKILDWISPVPHGKLHDAVKEKRTSDTCEWLLRHEMFREWENNTSSVVLWLQGSPGAGKTFLTSKVIDHVQNMLHMSSIHEGFAFFYCNRHELNRREPLSVLRSYVRQLSTTADHPGNVKKELRDLYQSTREKGSDLSFDMCKEQLLDSVNLYPRTTLVLDALDECNQDSRNRLVEAIEFLLSNAKMPIKVFISSRPDRDIRSQFINRSNIEIQARNNEEDIRKYVDERIKEHGSWGDMSSSLKRAIVNVLLEHSEEMFQWVALQINQILDLESEKAIRDRLGRLPLGLSAAYDEIYSNIRSRHKHDKAIADRAFMWVMCAFKSLSKDELLAAVCIDPEEGSCAADKVTESQLLHLCNNLLVLDSQRNVWKLSHLSVAEYFEEHHWGLRQAHCYVARTCLRLLIDTYAEANSEIHDVIVNNTNDTDRHVLLDSGHPLHLYSRHHWIRHVQTQEGQTADSLLVYLLKTFLGSPTESSVQYRKWWNQIWSERSETPSTSSFSHGCWNEIFPHNAVILLMCRFALYTVLSDWWDAAEITISQTNVRGDSLLALAAAGGSIPICETLLSRGIQIDTTGGHHGSALATASCNGLVEVVKFLVDRGADVNLLLPRRYYGSALAAASYNGHIEIVRLLVNQGADVNMPLHGGSEGSALATAVYTEQTRVIDFLLDRGADINMLLPHRGSALVTAIHTGKPEIVKFLVDRGADINLALQNGKYGSALAIAIRFENMEVIELLLDRGAHINMPLHYGKYGSALAAAASSAASRGHIHIMEFLFSRGAKVHMLLQNGEFGRALHTAEYKGHIEVSRFLIDRGSDCSVTDESGAIPLITASRHGDAKIVRLLIECSGSAPYAEDNNGRSALFWAARNGHLSAFLSLLHYAGSAPHSKDWYGSTPLFAAVRNGHFDIVRELCDTACHSEDLTDGFGHSLLWWARRAGDSEIIQIIVDLFQRMKFDDDTAVESSPVQFDPGLGWCNACTRCIQKKSKYYRCEICDGGNFDVCWDCFNDGVKCRDASHILEERGP